MSAPVPANQPVQIDRQVVRVFRATLITAAGGVQRPGPRDQIGEFTVTSPHLDERRRLAKAEVLSRFGQKASISTGRALAGTGRNRTNVLIATIQEPEES
jgi:hypothetical protein